MISPFNKKLIILSDVYLHYRDDDEFKEFAEYNDLGLPLAHVCATGLAQIKPDGVDCIEETYDLLVDAMGLDPDVEYDSVEDMIELLEPRDPNTPAAALEKLALDEEPYIGGKVATNPNTQTILLEKYALDEDPWKRGQAARHPNTPAAVFEKLALDEDPHVRGQVASNPNTPAAVLEKLALDAEPWIRGKVATNPNTPAAVLEKLALDGDILPYMR